MKLSEARKYIKKYHQYLRENRQLRRDLAMEKERRIHWQGLTYEAMRLVDVIFDGHVIDGTGTCEETFTDDVKDAIEFVIELKESSIES